MGDTGGSLVSGTSFDGDGQAGSGSRALVFETDNIDTASRSGAGVSPKEIGGVFECGAPGKPVEGVHGGGWWGMGSWGKESVY